MEHYSNGFVFTVNNPTAGDARLLHNPPELVSYIIFQLEVGSNGTEHFQGYMQTNMKISASSMRNKLNKRAHVEYEFSPALQNQHYCSKPVNGCECEHCSKPVDKIGGPWEYGSISHVRNDGASQCRAYTPSGLLCKLLAKEIYCKSHINFSIEQFRSSILDARRLRKIGLTFKQIEKKTSLSEYQIQKSLNISDIDFDKLLNDISGKSD